MTQTLSLFLTLGIGLLVMPFAQAQVQAADYPVKTVRLIVPFPPGGATDALARLMAEKLSERWKQAVLVENRPGGNTVIGSDIVAKSAADGHVLGIVTGSHIINPLLGAARRVVMTADTSDADLPRRLERAYFGQGEVTGSVLAKPELMEH